MSSDSPSSSLTPFGGESTAPDLAGSIELVLLAKEGDGVALGDLFERYLPRLRRIVRARMGNVLARKMDADDLLQEVFLAATKSISSFELRTHAGILRWLTQIAENRIRDAIDRFRAEKRDVGREVSVDAGGQEDGHANFMELSDGAPPPSQIAARHELEELVDMCVHMIGPEPYRRVILLRDYYGEEWPEICAELKRPSIRACEELHRRAHVKLRKCLRPYLRGSNQ